MIYILITLSAKMCTLYSICCVSAPCFAVTKVTRVGERMGVYHQWNCVSRREEEIIQVDIISVTNYTRGL